jgi:hypothetical protein
MHKNSFRNIGCLLGFQLVCLVAFSQEITDASLTEKFRSYSRKAVQEKLFLHTDKEFYVAGEIVWFKIYYVNGVTHEPMHMSKIAYVEILNSNQEPVVQAKIALDPGSGKGSFYLPASMNTGYYSLRAYTNWMKNFEDDYFFEKRITIANTLKTPDTPAKDSVILSAAFFPEGGNLLNGIESKIGFSVTSNKGSIHQFRGYITNRNNDTVAAFSPLKFGIGHFNFRPEPGNSYKAIIALPDGTVFNSALPEIYDYGYAMGVKEDAQQIRITVKVKRRAGETAAEQVILAAHTRQVLSLAEKAFLYNDSTVFILDKKRIGSGVTYFTLFNSNGKPVCERLLYKKPLPGVALAVTSNQAAYGNRQKISLALSAQGAKAPFDLSASVFYIDTLQKVGQNTIVDYIWLTSELGDIESPGYYFSDAPEVGEATDNLMLTHGWRRFRWDDVLQGNDAFIKYLPEINGHLVTGKIKDTRNDGPAVNTNAYLSIPGRPFGFYASQSDKDGNVVFEVKNYYGNGQVIAQSGIDKDSFYRVEVARPYAEIQSRKKYSPYILTETLKEQLLQKSIGMQVQNIYTGDSLRNFDTPYMHDTLPFFGTPAATYLLDEYKRFTTMEEVLREYVREVGVGLSSQGLVFKIFDPVIHDFYPGNSLVLLDGVPLTNPHKIFSYDPLKIRRLDVVNARYVIGRSVFNGIASFSTYEPGFSAFELDPKLTAIDYSGLQLQREFYSPAYSTKEQIEKRIPDFRNTLYWSPDIRTGNDGKATVEFYSSDLKGKYLVTVQGLNEKGDLVSGSTVVEVK